MTQYHISKKARMFAAVAFVLGVTALAGTATYASGMPNQADHENALIAALVQKFNLNQADVKSVVDSVMTQQKAAHDAQRQQDFTARINAAVTAGKITQAQATLLLAKAQEVQTFMQGLESKPAADRKAAMKTEMDNIKQWLADNNIPKDYSLFLGFPGEKGNGGGRGAHGPKREAKPVN